ncbi:MAG: hypothetical protein U0736_17795 [Gemmataceae bacterium]
MCRDKRGQPATVFASTDDADYRALVAMARAGKDDLDRRKRFDMPGFRPTPQYLREMRHYGVLAADHADDAPVDPYAGSPLLAVVVVPSGRETSLTSGGVV